MRPNASALATPVVVCVQRQRFEIDEIDANAIGRREVIRTCAAALSLALDCCRRQRCGMRRECESTQRQTCCMTARMYSSISLRNAAAEPKPASASALLPTPEEEEDAIDDEEDESVVGDERDDDEGEGEADDEAAAAADAKSADSVDV